MMREFEQAKDKVMMGAERKSMVMSEKESATRPTTKRDTPSSGGGCPSTTRSTR